MSRFFNFPSLQVPFKLQRIEGNCHAFSRDVPVSCKSPTLRASTHMRHADSDVSPATINATNNGLGRRELGLGFMDWGLRHAVCSSPMYIFFSISFYCTNAYNAYFDSTYGHYHHQQKHDDMWTTTTASLTRQNMVTTSTCQNASMTTVRPLGHATMINGSHNHH